ncbi:MAG: IS200/IS605 family transposase [Blastocatellia bacterium]
MSQSTVTNLLHIVFSTKNRVEIIREETEDELYKYMSGIFRNKQSPCIAINGTSNHVHMLVSLSKNIALADIMEDLKKDSSKWIKTKGDWYRDFHWQDGYGAFSIGQSGVSALKEYIAKQKEHHKKVRFEDEFVALLKKYKVEYDERYLWS